MSSSRPFPSLAIVNAKIWTGDRRPWADAILVRGERIELVGSSAEVKKRSPATTTIDAKGMMVVPGFVDTHVTLLDGGLALTGETTSHDGATRLRALDAAMACLAAHGVTGVHHMGSWDDVALFQAAHEAGALRLRIDAAVPLSTWTLLRDSVASRGRGDAWLRIGGLAARGGGGGPTAASSEELSAWISGADAEGLQPIVYAPDEEAISSQLDLFARVARENGGTSRRFRIAHAADVAPADIPRFAALGVIAGMQPSRAAHAARPLLDAKATLAFGSGWPLASPAPLAGIHAAAAQGVAVHEALRAYTAGAAHAGYREQELGVLAPRMLADLVMIDRDVTSVPPATIGDARVMLTMVGGRVVFERT